MCLSMLQRRIDDLEAFYIANVDDERSVLFEKQRLRLRKLLSEYDGISAGAVSAAAALPSAGAMSAPPPSAGPAYLTSGSGAGAAAMAGFASGGGYGQGSSTGAGYSLGGSAPGSTGAGGSSLPGAGAGHAGAAAAAGAGGTITKEIREDTRLSLSELLAWFTQAGVAEMPEVHPEYVEAVFANVTRTNTDGKMSVRLDQPHPWRSS